MGKSTGGERYTINDSLYISSEKRKEIVAELDSFRGKYALSSLTKEKIGRFYSTNQNVKIGNVSKIIELISYILKCYGYTDEERDNFLNANRRMLLSNYADFRIRLSIFCKCGLFDEVFFKNGNVLNYEFVTQKLDTRTLFAVAKAKNYNITLSDLQIISNFTTEFKSILREIHPLDQEERTLLDKEMADYLKSIYKENNNKLKREAH